MMLVWRAAALITGSADALLLQAVTYHLRTAVASAIVLA